MRTFQQNNYIFEDNTWKLQLSDTLSLPVEKNVITLKFKNSISDAQRQEMEAQYQLTFLREAPLTHWIDYKVPDGTDIFDLVNGLLGDEQVDNIEIPVQARPMSSPNDTYYNLQWYLNDPTAGIHIEDAWDLAGNCEEIIVGIVDTGVQTNHIDLSSNIFVNSAEISGVSGVDDDNNGYVDDVNGWNAVYGNGNILPVTLGHPSIVSHGTLVNGIIGAERDNNEGIAGIAGNVKLLNASVIENSGAVSGAAIDDALQYLFINNVRLINMSLLTGYSPALNDTYDILLANEIPVIMPRRIIPFNSLPPLHPVIIPVSGTNAGNGVLMPSSNGQYDFSWIAAPGDGLYTTGLRNSYLYSPNFVPQVGPMGTSFSAAVVSGVMALMYCQAPCLSINEVKEILKNTADKVGNYNYNYDANNTGHSRELGYGKINAYQAVLAARNYGSNLGFTRVMRPDLFIKDNIFDYGGEPSRFTYYEEGVDIWIRLQNDSIPIHQKPYFGTDHFVYVNVKVTNRSCRPSVKGHILQLYWAKMSVDPPMRWPGYWDGSNPTNPSLGGKFDLEYYIGAGEIQPGESKLYVFPWHIDDLPTRAQEQIDQIPEEIRGPIVPPYPVVFNYALLARVIHVDNNIDPMYVPEGPDAFVNKTNNNNIATRRLHILSMPPNSNNNSNPFFAIFPITNNGDEAITIDMQFFTPDSETGKLIFAEADTHFKMDNNLLQIWKSGGELLEDMLQMKAENDFKIKENYAQLKNIRLPAHTTYWARIDINYLTKELTQKDNHSLLIAFTESATGKELLTRQFLIRKPDAWAFDAEAEDVETEKNEPVTIEAEDIGEPAVYNWYDPEGNLIYTGKDLTVSPEITETYKLEIIRNEDGFKDTKEVEVKVKPDRIESLSPNPATDVLNIQYKAHNAGSAYLIITGTQNNVSQNYILNGELEQVQIDLVAYPAGYYGVALVCDGQIVDSKTFQKQ